jgi:hypothetical protein
MSEQMIVGDSKEVHGLASAEYFSTPAISNSGMKDLAVSPLRFWYLHLNPDRPAPRETPEMAFGTALHCAVLEPDKFADRYVCEAIPSFYDGCLVTMDDLRTWCKSKGLGSSAKNKRELIDRVLSADPSVPIFDLIEAEQQSSGKRILSQEDWQRVKDASESLCSQQHMKAILAAGKSEASFFAIDEETGVPMKARMDWITATVTLDIKTFSNSRGKSIDRAVADAIYYEGYHLQAYFYTMLRKLVNPGIKPPTFLFAFVENCPPYEVRFKQLQPLSHGQANVYWERARIDIRHLIRLYAECSMRFGSNPWRYEQGIETLEDSDIPQLGY